jgi:hypothetical protein
MQPTPRGGLLLFAGHRHLAVNIDLTRLIVKIGFICA